MTESSKAAETERLRLVLDIPDTILNLDGRIVIQTAHDPWAAWDAVPFVIRDVHNLYEWSMVLSDQHPYHPMWCAGSETGADDERREDLRMTAISLSEKSQAIFKAIKTARQSGMIKPVHTWRWYEREPDDATLLVFRRDDILKVISDRRADGVVISMLLAERDQQMDSETVGAVSVGSEPSVAGDRETDHRVEAANEAPPGNQAVTDETPHSKTTTRRGGRKPGSGSLNDETDLLDILHLLAAGEAPSVWAAAKPFADGNDSIRRRLHGKFSKKWGTDPPEGKTWKDVEDELKTN